MSTRFKPNKIHLTVHLVEASSADAGKAIGVLLRKYLTPELVACKIERTSNTRISRRAESVLSHFLELPRVPITSVPGASARTQKIVFNDAKVARLANEWDRGLEEYAVVVPHMFYLPLLRLFLRNLEQQAPEIRSKVRFFFDYAHLEGHELLRRCFLGERTQVLRHLQKIGAPYIDCARQLLLENLISLACYTIPCRYLVFVDDDFFVKDKSAVQRLLDPLQNGYKLSGIFVKRVQRIHTCLFAMRPEYLRDHLSLFDNGTNLYAEDLRSTGSITYQALASRKKGVFSVADFDDDDGSLGQHLGHCAGELWADLPGILHRVIPYGELPKGIGRMKLDVPVLLESLAEAFQLSCPPAEYKIIGNNLRRNAHKQFPAYLEKLYGNHRWLIANAGAC